MARSVYHYSKYSRPVAWIAAIVLVCAFGTLLYCYIFDTGDLSSGMLLVNILCGGSSFVFLLTSRIEIDDESGILTYHNLGKVTVDLRKVDRIARHLSAKGKLRYATFHEAGVKYADVAISSRHEAAFIAQIRRINPDVEIVTYKG